MCTVAFILYVFAQQPDDNDPKKNQNMNLNHDKCTVVLDLKFRYLPGRHFCCIINSLDLKRSTVKYLSCHKWNDSFLLIFYKIFNWKNRNENAF